MTAKIVTLSRLQIPAFLNDRLDGTGPCIVRETLDWAALGSTSVVPGARTLMAELMGDGARLTDRGNLTRKLVGKLMDGGEWPGCDIAALRSICKVFNEEDFPPAMYLHAVLRLAGLARREKDHLKLTRKGRAMLSEVSAGQLQATLFRATFTRYNLGYLDGIGRPEIFGPQISLILYLIGQLCTDWGSADELMRSVALPLEEPRELVMGWLPALSFELRVLRYLCWFGLLEQSCPAPVKDRPTPRLFRKTPLFDEALRFALW